MLNRCCARTAGARLSLAVAGTAGIFLLAGCAAHVDTNCAVPCAVNEGVPYHLPKRLAKVTVVEVEEGKYSAMLSESQSVADKNQFYAAVPKRNIWKSKLIDLRTTPDGMMSSAFTTSENRNTGIADNIRLNTVFFNKEGLKDELHRGLHYQDDAKVAMVAGREAGVVAFEGIFDPQSGDDVSRMNCSLKKYKMELEVAGPPQGEQFVKVATASGVILRPSTMQPVYIHSSKDKKVIASLGGASTDKPLFNLPLDNGAFARDSHNVEFREGQITGYYNRQPSEIHGVLQGAREVVEDIFSVPAAAIAPVAAAIEVARPATSQGGGESPSSASAGATATGGTGGISGMDFLKGQIIQEEVEDQYNNDQPVIKQDYTVVQPQFSPPTLN